MGCLNIFQFKKKQTKICPYYINGTIRLGMNSTHDTDRETDTKNQDIQSADQYFTRKTSNVNYYATKHEI